MVEGGGGTIGGWITSLFPPSILPPLLLYSLLSPSLFLFLKKDCDQQRLFIILQLILPISFILHLSSGSHRWRWGEEGRREGGRKGGEGGREEEMVLRSSQVVFSSRFRLHPLSFLFLFPLFPLIYRTKRQTIRFTVLYWVKKTKKKREDWNMEYDVN